MSVLVPSAIVLPVSAAIVRHKRWKAPEKNIFFYLVFSGVFEVIATSMARRGINNMPLMYLYTIMEFCILGFTLRCFFTNKKVRILLTWLIIFFPVITIAYIYFTASLFAFNTIPRFVSSLILMVFCLYFLIENLVNIHTYNSAFKFSIVVGLLIYFSSSSTLFGLITYVPLYKTINTFFWTMHATLELIMYLIFTVAYIRLKPTS
jgi:hypothetical protein